MDGKSIVGIAVSITGGAIIQLSILIYWGGHVDARLTTLEQTQRDQDQNMARIDSQGSRAIPIVQDKINQLDSRFIETTKRLQTVIEQIDRLNTPLSKIVQGMREKLDLLSDTEKTVNAMQQAHIEELAHNIQRIEERENRIVQALDAIYNQVQDLRIKEKKSKQQ